MAESHAFSLFPYTTLDGNSIQPGAPPPPLPHLFMVDLLAAITNAPEPSDVPHIFSPSRHDLHPRALRTPKPGLVEYRGRRAPLRQPCSLPQAPARAHLLHHQPDILRIQRALHQATAAPTHGRAPSMATSLAEHNTQASPLAEQASGRAHALPRVRDCECFPLFLIISLCIY